MTKLPLLPLENALAQLLDHVQASSQTHQVAIEHVLNQVAAETVKSTIQQPPFDNSAVDGYAFHIEDLEAGALPVTLRVAAGDAPQTLAPQQAARIFTGAPVPKGANCVLMQESATIEDREGTPWLSTDTALKVGQNIRPAGQDFANGDTILNKGDVLRPQNISLLAAAGIASVKVVKPLKVAVLSTGDELVQPGQTLKPGQIYNSNHYLLNALLENFGCEVLSIPSVKDTLDDCKQALNEAATADLIISSGGASVGEEDYIKSAIEALGSIDFWRIAIKPGKPFMLGEVKGTPILGLPGNPSAVLVTFLILARAVILKRKGCRTWSYKSLHFPLAKSIKKAGIRREFLRVRLDDNLHLASHPNQSSGMMSSSCWAEGFAVIKEHTCPQAGDKVEFIPFTHLLQHPETLLDFE